MSVTTKEIWKTAGEKINKNKCKVCPVCDGKACGGLIPGMGGMGSGATFRNNIEAFAKKNLVMRVLHEASDVNCELTLWGRKLSMPVFAAPIGDIVSQIDGHLSIPQYTQHLIDGCIKVGTLASIGDLIGCEPFAGAIAEIKGRGKSVIPFIKTWVRDEFVKKFELVAKAGCDICGTDVDSAGLAGLRNSPTPVNFWTAKELSACIKKVKGFGMKYIVKGIMTVEEAKIAVDCGADAVLVSNHGGRVLDYGQGTAEVLPEIAQAVGKLTIVMVDGGIRSGADVLKALALGAKATLICRPAAIAVHGDEQNGISTYFANIKNELIHAMRMTGCKNLDEVSGKIIC
ncbi:MAG: alpha-hydroxy-acid oxidizing protein [Elusimicrobiota bacterium]|jgi:isopentenyl diphosphate isomerase/L-lactate dehydrogenase-like FMN-dependent dehydrogenase|nr:alpha-hydroxy-acid oxidizing protein [Elusimicrobiota bacterium]